MKYNASDFEDVGVAKLAEDESGQFEELNPSEKKEEIGSISGSATRLFNSATMNFGDEIAGTAAKAVGKAMSLWKDVDLEKFNANVDKLTKQEEEKRKLFAEQSPALAIIADLAGGVAIPGGVATKGLTKIPSLAKAAATGAATGGLWGLGEEGDIGDRATSGLTGAAIGAAIPLAGAGIKSAILPKIAEGVKPLARTAMDKYGIDLSMSQLAGGGKTPRNILASTVEQIPLTGASKFRKQQQEAFNRSVLETIGESSSKVTPEIMDSAYNKIGQQFDDAVSGEMIPISDEIVTRLAKLEKDSSRLTKDNAEAIRNNIKMLFDEIEGDSILGEKLGQMRSEIGRAMKSGGVLSPYLAELRDIVMDIATSQNPEKKALLLDAMSKYRAYKTIEPLAGKAVNGDITPSLLLNRVRQQYGDFSRGGGGNLGELARIGQLFLKDKVPDSGTAARLTALGAIVGVPSMFMGGLPLVTAVKAIGTGALFNKVNTSKLFTRLATK